MSWGANLRFHTHTYLYIYIYIYILELLKVKMHNGFEVDFVLVSIFNASYWSSLDSIPGLRNAAISSPATRSKSLVLAKPFTIEHWYWMLSGRPLPTCDLVLLLKSSDLVASKLLFFWASHNPLRPSSFLCTIPFRERFFLYRVSDFFYMYTNDAWSSWVTFLVWCSTSQTSTAWKFCIC